MHEQRAIARRAAREVRENVPMNQAKMTQTTVTQCAATATPP